MLKINFFLKNHISKNTENYKPWLHLDLKEDSLLQFWSVERTESGLTPRRLKSLPVLHPEDTSEPLSRTVLSEREMSKSTLDSEPSKDSPKREREDTWVLVREEVAPMPECQPKSFGSGDKEPSEDFWESTEPKERSILRCTKSFICCPKVTFSRTRRFLSRLLFLKRPRLRETILSWICRNKEETTTKRKERENSSRRLRDNRTDNV